MKIFDSVQKTKREFIPLQEGKASLYVCGPTVYDDAHLGHAKSALVFDLLTRVLKANGYDVTYARNITDIDDKIIKKALEQGKDIKEITDFYTATFHKEMQAIGVNRPDIEPKATESLEAMYEMIQKLIDSGHAYATSDGDVYFDTSSDSEYLTLSQRVEDEEKRQERVENSSLKKNAADFALWKFSQPDEKRQMEWDAFGRKGFPGWHIECSAMSMKYLGEQFDIHCGGVDHIPIHHTNEIAQSETATGKKPWVKYWMHGEFLVMGSDKMAKSAGNFITLDTLREKNIHPLAYRYFLLQTHYRKQLNFSWEALDAAKHGWANLYNQVQNLGNYDIKEGLWTWTKGEVDKVYKEKFLEAINDDLNTPQALAIAHDMLKSDLPTKNKLGTIIDFDKILGLKLFMFETKEKHKKLDGLQNLLRLREVARQEKNWTESDRLRDGSSGDCGYFTPLTSINCGKGKVPRHIEPGLSPPHRNTPRHR